MLVLLLFVVLVVPWRMILGVNEALSILLSVGGIPMALVEFNGSKNGIFTLALVVLWCTLIYHFFLPCVCMHNLYAIQLIFALAIKHGLSLRLL